jgi:hypothetical protein
MGIGSVGFHGCFEAQYGLLGRLGVGLTAVGVFIIASLLLRSVSLFVVAGFRPVPAVGEAPASLLISAATFVGIGCTLVGAGVIGATLRGIDRQAGTESLLLLSAPAIPIALSVLRLLSAFPVPLDQLVVSTNVAFLPFGITWVALGRLLRSA